MNLKDWAILVRLPNLPTPLADIGLGLCACFAAGFQPASDTILALCFGSLSLYAGGMILNDWCDRSEDAGARPDRPIPAGRIRPGVALLAGCALLVFGCLMGFWADLIPGKKPLCGPVALTLAGTILLYDAWAKHTPFGPVAMGTCRALNVLFGATAGNWGPQSDWLVLFLPALTSGLFIAGVTWFARTEEKSSDGTQLRLASLVLGVALALAALLPAAIDSPLPWIYRALLAWGLIGFLLWILAPKVIQANREPVPARVQSAVGWMIAAYIPFQASQASGLAGVWGLCLLPLLALVLFLRRWRWLKPT